MALPTALVDSAVLIAAANPSDRNHAAATGALRAESELATPATILAETMSFIRARLGGQKQHAFWDAFVRSGIAVVDVDAETLALGLEIDARYADADFGFAGAVLLASCERLRCPRILSFDRKLAIYRPTLASHLEVLP